LSPKRILALALGLLVAAVASAVAPTHPLYNPPVTAFVLGAMALAAAIWAWESARQPAPVLRNADASEFVVSFDDREIVLTYSDGTTDAARFDELERISIEPEDNSYLDWWTGPFIVALHVRDRRLLIPAFTVGLQAFLGRLLELPGIDRDGLYAILRGGELSSRVVWTRGKGS